MRRTLAWPIAVLLALATGGVAGQTVAVLTVPDMPAVSTGSSDTAAAVRAYYTAVNAVLRDGDPAPLVAALAPDFRDESGPGGTPTDRDGLAQGLLALRAVAPGTWIAIEEMDVVGDRALVRVSPREAEPRRFIGLTVADGPPLWAKLDLFRVAGGLVAERRGDPAGRAVLEPLGRLAVDRSAPPYAAVQLDEVVLRPGGVLSGDTGAGIALVVTGSVAVADVATGADVGDSSRAAAGEVVAIPGDRRHALASAGAGPAIVLAARISVMSPESGAYPGGKPGYPTGGTSPALIGSKTLRAGGLTTRLPSPSLAVAFGRVTLAPGAALTFAATTMPVLLTVEAGSLGIAAASTSIWLRDGSTGETDTPPSGVERTLITGDGAFVPTGGGLILINRGTIPTVLVMATIDAA